MIQKKRDGVPAVRQLMPAAFVVALGGSVALAAKRRWPRWLAAVAAPYLAANLAASVKTAGDEPELLPWLPPAFATFHLAYGLGSLQGLWRYRRRWADRRLQPTERTRLTDVYAGYADDAHRVRWDDEHPGDAMVTERDAAIHELLAASPRWTPDRGPVLDVGCGNGDLAGFLDGSKLDGAGAVGVDLLDRLALARSGWGPRFARADGTALPIADASVGLALAFTVFSSILDPAVQQALADELTRVLARARASPSTTYGVAGRPAPAGLRGEARPSIGDGRRGAVGAGEAGPPERASASRSSSRSTPTSLPRSSRSTRHRTRSR